MKIAGDIQGRQMTFPFWRVSKEINMERIAVISDIHGNLPALEAVLKDIKKQNIERIYCLGDLAGKGPSPAEVVP